MPPRRRVNSISSSAASAENPIDIQTGKKSVKKGERKKKEIETTEQEVALTNTIHTIHTVSGMKTSEETFESLGIKYESINCSGAIRERGFGGFVFAEHKSCINIGGERELFERGKWPEKNSGKCWYCLEEFEGPPMLIPRCKTISGVYEVFGNFCGVPCAHQTVASGLFETHAGHRSLFLQMLQIGAPHVFDESGAAPLQPSLRDRIDFGGTIDVEHWKLRTLPIDFSKMPPIAPCLMAISTLQRGEQERDQRLLLAQAIASEKAKRKQLSVRCEICGDFVREGFVTGIPVRRMPWGSEYECVGTFCDVACAHRHLVSTPFRNHAVNYLFVQMCFTNFSRMCDSFGRVALAPPIIERADFGGSVSVDDWYVNKFLCAEVASVVFPPFAPTLIAVGKRYFGDRDFDLFATRASRPVLLELLKTDDQIQAQTQQVNESIVVDFPSMTNISHRREHPIRVQQYKAPRFLSLVRSSIQ